MPVPGQRIPTQLLDTEAICAFAADWAIHEALAFRLSAGAEFLSRSGLYLNMQSGYRSPTRQEELGRDAGPGDTVAPVDLSTHTTCPAVGADIGVDGFTKRTAPKVIRWQVGSALRLQGLRWGGGGPEEDWEIPEMGTVRIPVDWNHFDLGSRADLGL